MSKGLYYKVYDFMTEDLELSGNELLVYAFIFSFSQNKGANYIGSAQYIAKRTKASLRTVRTCIRTLQQKRLLLVIKKDETHSEYHALSPRVKKDSFSDDNGANSAPYPPENNSAKNVSEWCNICTINSANSAPNKDNINIYSLDCQSNNKKANIPKLEDVKAYVANNNLQIDPDKFFIKNQERGWITKSGEPVRSWKNLLRYWDKIERVEKVHQQEMMTTEYNYDEIERQLMRN